MKNILIPTTLEADTVCAVKTAIKQAKGKNCTIMLMLLKDTPQAYSATTFLRSTKQVITCAQQEVINECRNIVNDTQNCTLKIHNQYGVSKPLLKNLLQHFAIDLIVLCPSYKAEKQQIHTYCFQILLHCKSPILHIGGAHEGLEFNKALYIEYENTKFGLQELQQLVNKQFDFKIVSKANFEEQNPKEISPLLTEAISKNNIDLLIETRKAERMKRGKGLEPINETLGLPVLSLHEETAKAFTT